MEYNKLVRDKIDDIIISNGEVPVTRILSLDEYQIELVKKLEEEYLELVEAINLGDNERILEESADLFEVVKACNELTGNSFGDVIDAMAKKCHKKGGFSRRLFLEKTIK